MIAHCVGGGPFDGNALDIPAGDHTIYVPTLTGFDDGGDQTFGMVRYVLESADPDGLIGTYRFAGWPDGPGRGASTP
jgi:hypothetical protein